MEVEESEPGGGSKKSNAGAEMEIGGGSGRAACANFSQLC